MKLKLAFLSIILLCSSVFSAEKTLVQAYIDFLPKQSLKCLPTLTTLSNVGRENAYARTDMKVDLSLIPEPETTLSMTFMRTKAIAGSPPFVAVVTRVTDNLIELQEYPIFPDNRSIQPPVWYLKFELGQDTPPGTLVMTHQTTDGIDRSNILNAKHETQKVFQFWGDRIQSVHGIWVDSINLEILNRVTKEEQLPLSQAVTRTWTGQLMNDLGFKVKSVFATRDGLGVRYPPYDDAKVTFVRK